MSFFSTPLSALRSLSTALAASAHDVANVHTDDFQGTDAVFEDAPGGGVAVRLRRDESPAPPLPEPFALESGHFASNTDLTRETVDRLRFQRAFEANLEVVAAEDERIEALFDEIG